MARLTGNYQEDLPQLERVVALTYGDNDKTGRPVLIAPAAGQSGRLRLDCLVVPWKAGPVLVAFNVPHTLGRVPTLWWIVDSGSATFLQPANRGEWSATNVSFLAGVQNASGLILLA